MLSKNQRIPRSMFPISGNNLKVFKNDLFLLKLAPSPDKTRFCFSISKKVAKNAVLRNKLRRQGYRIIKEFLSKINKKNLVVFSFKKTPKNELEIKNAIESIIKQSNLI